MNSITGKRKRPADAALYIIIVSFTISVSAMVVYFIGYILFKGVRGVTLSFLTTAPNPINNTVGILPAIINTVYIIFLSLLVAVPVGVGGAIYINEYAKSSRLIRLIEFTTETLSGVPSIIFGVFGYVFFCMFLGLKVSLISGAFTLTLMVLPIIIRTTQEALKAVPVSYREGAAGLGATKWYMIRTILIPSASGGIITAVILSVGRIVGESAALILVAGGSAMYMPKGNFFQQIMGSGSTLSVELYRYAYSRGENEIGFAIAAILLVIVILLNLTIKTIKKRLNGGAK
ncbi:MAG: phosphate ABC transporter permease PstA [Clostridiales bacterium]|nr:phosphate ABC transporter permease PstA [Clostridiales bacterium]